MPGMLCDVAVETVEQPLYELTSAIVTAVGVVWNPCILNMAAPWQPIVHSYNVFHTVNCCCFEQHNACRRGAGTIACIPTDDAAGCALHTYLAHRIALEIHSPLLRGAAAGQLLHVIACDSQGTLLTCQHS
jgi:hypothetical protein